MKIISIESWRDGIFPGGSQQQQRRKLTFETLTTRFLVEVLLAAVVGYVSTIFLNLSQRVDLVPLDFEQRTLVQALERWEVHHALRLGLDEAARVFDHLGLF